VSHESSQFRDFSITNLTDCIYISIELDTMVGKRAWGVDPPLKKVPSGGTGPHRKSARKTSESPNGFTKPPAFRFQDTPQASIEEEISWRDQFMTKLLNGVNRESLEQYHKSDDEVYSLP
jgi:hypothetical protein